MCVYPRFPILQTLAYVFIQITVVALTITTNNITQNSSHYDVFLFTYKEKFQIYPFPQWELGVNLHNSK
jgi:hypothetical protein